MKKKNKDHIPSSLLLLVSKSTSDYWR